jgi:predicted MFS family arabinose efflux permease
LVFGLKHAGIPASTLAAGAAVPLLVLTVGWRPTFALSSLFAILAWVLIHFEPETNRDRVQTEAITAADRPLSRRQLVTLALGSSLATWAAVYLGAFLVAAAVDASFTESEAGVLLFIGSAASIGARVVYGLWADRRAAAGFGGVSLIMASGAVAFALTANAAGAAFAVGVVVGFILGWGWPGLMTYAVVNTNTQAAASSSAVTQAGIFLGAGIGPVALGWAIDSWSFSAAWLVVAILLATASLVVLTVAAQRRKLEPLPQEG